MRNGYFALLGFCFVVVCLLPGCGSIAQEYVAADRATYEAVAPEYQKYVDADPALDDDAKALRKATLASWAYRMEQAEKAGK
jgi:hypothetical protein